MFNNYISKTLPLHAGQEAPDRLSAALGLRGDQQNAHKLIDRPKTRIKASSKTPFVFLLARGTSTIASPISQKGLRR